MGFVVEASRPAAEEGRGGGVRHYLARVRWALLNRYWLGVLDLHAAVLGTPAVERLLADGQLLADLADAGGVVTRSTTWELSGILLSKNLEGVRARGETAPLEEQPTRPVD